MTDINLGDMAMVVTEPMTKLWRVDLRLESQDVTVDLCTGATIAPKMRVRLTRYDQLALELRSVEEVHELQTALLHMAQAFEHHLDQRAKEEAAEFVRGLCDCVGETEGGDA
jgi:transposase InsO family protein